jgi:uncharacterized protein
MDLISLSLFLVIVFVSNFYAASSGGASILILPAMFFFGVPPALAVGTNRLHRVFATGAMAFRFLKEIRLDNKEILEFILVSVFGSVIGAFIVLNLDQNILKNFILTAIFLVIIFLIINRKFGLKERKFKPSKVNDFVSYIFIFICSIYRAIIGSAAGTFLRLYLIGVRGQDYIKASAMASPIAFASSLVATIIFMFYGIVDYVLALEMIIAGVLGGYLGAHFAVKKGNKFIQAVFFTVTILMIIKILLFG